MRRNTDRDASLTRTEIRQNADRDTVTTRSKGSPGTELHRAHTHTQTDTQVVPDQKVKNLPHTTIGQQSKQIYFHVLYEFFFSSLMNI